MTLTEDDYCQMARDIIDMRFPYGGYDTAILEKEDEILGVDFGLFPDYRGIDRETGEMMTGNPSFYVYNVQCKNTGNCRDVGTDFDEKRLQDEVLRLLA